MAPTMDSIPSLFAAGDYAAVVAARPPPPPTPPPDTVAALRVARAAALLRGADPSAALSTLSLVASPPPDAIATSVAHLTAYAHYALRRPADAATALAAHPPAVEAAAGRQLAAQIAYRRGDYATAAATYAALLNEATAAGTDSSASGKGGAATTAAAPGKMEGGPGDAAPVVGAGLLRAPSLLRTLSARVGAAVGVAPAAAYLDGGAAGSGSAAEATHRRGADDAVADLAANYLAAHSLAGGDGGDGSDGGGPSLSPASAAAVAAAATGAAGGAGALNAAADAVARRAWAEASDRLDAAEAAIVAAWEAQDANADAEADADADAEGAEAPDVVAEESGEPAGLATKLAPLRVQRAYVSVMRALDVDGDDGGRSGIEAGVEAALTTLSAVVRQRHTDAATLTVATNNLVVCRAAASAAAKGGGSRMARHLAVDAEALRRLKASANKSATRKLTPTARAVAATNRAVLLAAARRWADADRAAADVAAAVPGQATLLTAWLLAAREGQQQPQQPAGNAAAAADAAGAAGAAGAADAAGAVGTARTAAAGIDAAAAYLDSIDPPTPVSRAGLAVLQLNAGRPAAAAAALTAAFPGRPAAALTASALYERAGSPADAIAALRIGLATGGSGAAVGDGDPGLARSEAGVWLAAGDHPKTAAALRTARVAERAAGNTADVMGSAALVIATVDAAPAEAASVAASLPLLPALSAAAVDALEAAPPPMLAPPPSSSAAAPLSRRRSRRFKPVPTLAGAPLSGVVPSSGGDEAAVAAAAGTQKKKKRKTRLPRGYTPGDPPPDPERWVPLRLRAANKKRLRRATRRAEEVGRGAQGADAAAAERAAAALDKSGTAAVGGPGGMGGLPSGAAAAAGRPKGAKAKKKRGGKR
ncbi:hypothetical protein MMPV_000446 [Pyropia vietnamensis]